MKPNTTVRPGPIKALWIDHWEKLAFAGAALAAIWLLGAALLRKPYAETPGDLLRKAEEVDARLAQLPSPETIPGLPPRRNLRAKLRNSLTSVNPSLFPMSELARPYSDHKVRRNQPKLLAVQDVRAFAGFGAIAISNRDLGRERFEAGRSGAGWSMLGKSGQTTAGPTWQGDDDANERIRSSAAAGNPVFQPGAATRMPYNDENLEGAPSPGRRNRRTTNRRPRSQHKNPVSQSSHQALPQPEHFELEVPKGAKLEGRYWVAVVGLIPTWEQESEFHRVFRDATKTFAAEIPLYLYCDVQRAEVGPNGQTGEFATLDMDQAADDIAYWAAVYPDPVDKRYLPASVDVASPLPSLVLANHDPNRVRHPLIPLAAAAEKVTPALVVERPEAKLKGHRHRAASPLRTKATRSPPAIEGSVSGRVADQRAAKPQQVERQLLRFFDFSVAPGKRYQYRVRLALYNPNYAVPRQYLADAKLAATSEIFTDWSAPTEEVQVPPGSELLAGEIDPAEPKAKVLVRQFDSAQAVTAVHVFHMSRGATANVDGVEVNLPRWQFDPRAPAPGGTKVNFKTDATMVDLVGGAPLAGGPAGSKAPARLLVMNFDGELAILSEAADAARFEIESAKLEAAKLKQPTMNSRR